MKLSVFTVDDQRDALRQLAELTQRSVLHPLVRDTAIRLTADCDPRDDTCELEAIFNAVKHGDPRSIPLKNGLRYVADPRWADHFTAPSRILQQCVRGACAEDCDGAAGLIAALAASVGFRVGLRVWGPSADDFVHVYAVAGVPKRDPTEVLGMDSTVPDSYLGWEPGNGHILTAWLE